MSPSGDNIPQKASVCMHTSYDKHKHSSKMVYSVHLLMYHVIQLSLAHHNPQLINDHDIAPTIDIGCTHTHARTHVHAHTHMDMHGLVSRARLSYPKREKESGESCTMQL